MGGQPRLDASQPRLSSHVTSKVLRTKFLHSAVKVPSRSFARRSSIFFPTRSPNPASDTSAKSPKVELVDATIDVEGLAASALLVSGVGAGMGVA